MSNRSISRGIPTPGYVLIRPVDNVMEIVPGLVDLSKAGLDPNGAIVLMGNMDSYPDYKGTLKVGYRVVVPPHVIQLFKYEGENFAIVHCTDIKFVFK